MEIENYLMGKNICPHLKGFDFLKDAIILIQADSMYKKYVTKKLYPKLAERFGETASKVERAMRYAIKSAGHYSCVSEFIAIAEIEIRKK